MLLNMLGSCQVCTSVRNCTRAQNCTKLLLNEDTYARGDIKLHEYAFARW